jgi:hypothetical protein
MADRKREERKDHEIFAMMPTIRSSDCLGEGGVATDASTETIELERGRGVGEGR